MFANNHKQTQQTDIVLTLTPHIVRVLDLTEDDLRPFRMGRDSGTAVGEVPQIIPRDEPINLPMVRDPTTAAPAEPAPAKPTFPQPLQPRCTNPPCR